MKGRPRKPGALRKLQGKSGHRRIPDEPAFASAIPTPPPYLAGEGLKEWNRMARRATELGVTTEADWAIFSNYCYAWQRHFGLATKLEKQTIGDAEWLKLHMEFDRVHKQLIKAIQELGFSPVTRSKVDAKKLEKVRDPFEVFEGGKATGAKT